MRVSSRNENYAERLAADMFNSFMPQWRAMLRPTTSTGRTLGSAIDRGSPEMLQFIIYQDYDKLFWKTVHP